MGIVYEIQRLKGNQQQKRLVSRSTLHHLVKSVPPNIQLYQRRRSFKMGIRLDRVFECNRYR